MKKLLTIFALMTFISFFVTAQPQLTWQFANYEVINAGAQLQFDVEVKANVAGTFHRDLQVYFDYNTAGFGSDIVAGGKIAVTNLTLMNTHYSVVNMADNTSSKFAIISEADNEMTQPGNSTYYNEMTDAYLGLFRITIDIDDNEEMAGIQFDSDLMDGGQYYQNASTTDPEKYAIACAYDNDLMSNYLGTLYGTITYANGASDPIENCTVTIGAVGTADTDVNGFYNYSGITTGVYALTTTCSLPWVKETTVNDVNLLIDHILLSTTLIGVQFLASDVDASGLVNINDVNEMIDNIVLIQNGYPSAPDWVFVPQTANVVLGVGTVSYQGLLIGDPDGSYDF